MSMTLPVCQDDVDCDGKPLVFVGRRSIRRAKAITKKYKERKEQYDALVKLLEVDPYHPLNKFQRRYNAVVVTLGDGDNAKRVVGYHKKDTEVERREELRRLRAERGVGRWKRS